MGGGEGGENATLTPVASSCRTTISTRTCCTVKGPDEATDIDPGLRLVDLLIAAVHKMVIIDPGLEADQMLYNIFLIFINSIRNCNQYLTFIVDIIIFIKSGVEKDHPDILIQSLSPLNNLLAHRGSDHEL